MNVENQRIQALEKPILIDEVRNFLPHRYPFLLIDRVTRIELPAPATAISDSSGKLGLKVKALKAISFAESCFQGHFPQASIYPGVLQIEIMAQAACFATYPFFPKDSFAKGGGVQERFSCALVGVDNARFRRPVTPGDLLEVEIEVTKHRGGLWGFKGVITVDGQKMAEADLLANIVVH
jgi:3-hydroxyacyl-[acyl-carrier-protein] dehydratase